jgi:3-deoxy-manno-octulosonate cytidylyltransferase (CMP-KDO synthetase)
MNILAIIPARLQSWRFPGKALIDIHGIPMFAHAALRASLCKSITAACVATCDEEIRQTAERLGITAVMTADSHRRCTDRTAEALRILEKELSITADIVVQVQGDEPMMTPAMIDAAIKPLRDDATLHVTHLMGDVADIEEFENRHEVKVVTDAKNNALYFSREPIPTRRMGTEDAPMKKAVNAMAFRRDALIAFSRLPEGVLERIESIDMLRLLENGEKMRMVPVSGYTLSVDVPDDHAKIVALMESDALRKLYTK